MKKAKKLIEASIIDLLPGSNKLVFLVLFCFALILAISVVTKS